MEQTDMVAKTESADREGVWKVCGTAAVVECWMVWGYDCVYEVACLEERGDCGALAAR
jgi:hypothetical protein